MHNIELLTLVSIAFFTSLGHCVGMCGGIVLAYSSCLNAKNALDSKLDSVDSIKSTESTIAKPSFLSQIPYHLAYHGGKITTYCFLGFIAGSIGQFAMPEAHIKHFALLIIGILLIIFGLSLACFAPLKRLFSAFSSLPSTFLHKLISIMRPLLQYPSTYRIFALGLCNGLLPCGIVYYFLLTAAVAGSGINGAFIMCLFGLACAPSLLTLGLLSSFLQHKRAIFLRLGGVAMVAFGGYEVYKSLKAMM
ncbi:sulfite exporter TauE/SafE family protein [Helicobacter jaachi]|uniref:Sulfite exporter TauE/SafE family protein n=1 Tax=Helicobacter jaachi TaxID=1677920 RepID=A0A4U8T903_9HELI|nr:sulfite exporter TauE/SafE family protein [Helicobacter jaachi]TLD96155.1 sulfite exporter TauE/SafE family protein [Helicobacter jaachi]